MASCVQTFFFYPKSLFFDLMSDVGTIFENVEGFMTNCLRILKFNGYSLFISLVFDISFKYIADHVFAKIKSSIRDPISQQLTMLFTIYSKTVAP